jgi:arylformamidase
MARRLIDLSHPLSVSTPPWPGNPGVDVTLLAQIPASCGPSGRGVDGQPGICNVSAFRTCTHTGTHMDAPAHFYNGVPTIDQIPLSQCIGPAVLIRLSEKRPREEITVQELSPFKSSIARTRKVVLDMGWAKRWGMANYFLDFPAIGEAAARWLIEHGVELVGVDTPSVDREPYPVHYALLEAHAVIVENLTNLNAVTQTEFELMVAPLPLIGLEASPVRAVAIVEE